MPMSTTRHSAKCWRLTNTHHFSRIVGDRGRMIMSPTRTMRNDAVESGRSYERAIQVINARRRIARPQEAKTSSTITKAEDASNPTPDSRGTPGIEGMAFWLQALGHSQDEISKLNVIHVAGTKGKGSTCAFAEAFLRAHGKRTGYPSKTGLYTSPHLIVPEERIRLNSKPLPQSLFAKYFFELYDRLPQLAEEFDPTKEVKQRGPRYLQLFALLAFHTFIREGVDVAIFETHCGGEYDATNVIEKPLVTAVTTLGMDHIDMLGPTIENIAWHKGGIYKPGSVALSAPQADKPAEVLRRRSEEKGQQVQFVEVDKRLPQDSLALRPDVQKINASVAVAAAQAFLDRCAPEECKELTIVDLEAGIKQFSWPGRFQVLNEGQWTWYLDAAHNDMSVKVAAQWFAEVSRDDSKQAGNPKILIFSHINELRDSAELLRSLGEALKAHGVHIDHVIFSTYDESDARKSHQPPQSPDLFRDAWEDIDSTSVLWSEPTIQGAIRRARELGPNGMHTLITGSQHLVGPSLRILNWSPEEQS